MARMLSLGKFNLQSIEEIEKHIEILSHTYLKNGNELVLSFIKHWQTELETKLLNIK